MLKRLILICSVFLIFFASHAFAENYLMSVLNLQVLNASGLPFQGEKTISLSLVSSTNAGLTELWAPNDDLEVVFSDTGWVSLDLNAMTPTLNAEKFNYPGLGWYLSVEGVDYYSPIVNIPYASRAASADSVVWANVIAFPSVVTFNGDLVIDRLAINRDTLGSGKVLHVSGDVQFDSTAYIRSAVFSEQVSFTDPARLQLGSYTFNKLGNGFVQNGATLNIQVAQGMMISGNNGLMIKLNPFSGLEFDGDGALYIPGIGTSGGVGNFFIPLANSNKNPVFSNSTSLSFENTSSLVLKDTTMLQLTGNAALVFDGVTLNSLIGHGVSVNSDGLFTVDTFEPSGLSVVTEGVAIRLAPSSGLFVDVDGLRTSFNATAGLKRDSTGLSVLLNPTGSIKSNSLGLYVDPDTDRGLKIDSSSNLISIKPGLGLGFDGSGNLQFTGDSADGILSQIYLMRNTRSGDTVSFNAGSSLSLFNGSQFLVQAPTTFNTSVLFSSSFVTANSTPFYFDSLSPLSLDSTALFNNSATFNSSFALMSDRITDLTGSGLKVDAFSALALDLHPLSPFEISSHALQLKTSGPITVNNQFVSLNISSDFIVNGSGALTLAKGSLDDYVTKNSYQFVTFNSPVNFSNSISFSGVTASVFSNSAMFFYGPSTFTNSNAFYGPSTFNNSVSFTSVTFNNSFTLNSDYFRDLTGAGLTLNGTALSVTVSAPLLMNSEGVVSLNLSSDFILNGSGALRLAQGSLEDYVTKDSQQVVTFSAPVTFNTEVAFTGTSVSSNSLMLFNGASTFNNSVAFSGASTVFNGDLVSFDASTIFNGPSTFNNSVSFTGVTFNTAFTLNSDYFTRLTGDGLTLNGTALSVTVSSPLLIDNGIVSLRLSSDFALNGSGALKLSQGSVEDYVTKNSYQTVTFNLPVAFNDSIVISSSASSLFSIKNSLGQSLFGVSSNGLARFSSTTTPQNSIVIDGANNRILFGNNSNGDFYYASDPYWNAIGFERVYGADPSHPVVDTLRLGLGDDSAHQFMIGKFTNSGDEYIPGVIFSADGNTFISGNITSEGNAIISGNISASSILLRSDSITDLTGDGLTLNGTALSVTVSAPLLMNSAGAVSLNLSSDFILNGSGALRLAQGSLSDYVTKDSQQVVTFSAPVTFNTVVAFTGSLVSSNTAMMFNGASGATFNNRVAFTNSLVSSNSSMMFNGPSTFNSSVSFTAVTFNTALTLGSDYFSDLTGDGLTRNGTALSVTVSAPLLMNASKVVSLNISDDFVVTSGQLRLNSSLGSLTEYVTRNYQSAATFNSTVAFTNSVSSNAALMFNGPSGATFNTTVAFTNSLVSSNSSMMFNGPATFNSAVSFTAVTFNTAFTLNSDRFTDLTGSGLTLNASNALSVTVSAPLLMNSAGVVSLNIGPDFSVSTNGSLQLSGGSVLSDYVTKNYNLPVTLNSSAYIAGATTFNNTVAFTNSVSSNASLMFNGSSGATFNTTVAFTGSLVSSNAAMMFNGPSTFNSSVSFTAVTFNTAFTLNSERFTDLTGSGLTLNVNALSVTVSAPLSINGSGVVSLNIGPDFSVSTNGSLQLSGGSVLSDYVTKNYNLPVTLNSVYISSVVTLNSSAYIAGATTLNSSAYIAGATTLNSSAYISGATRLNSTAYIAGVATLNSSAYIAGATTLNSSVYIAGATTINSTLYVLSTINTPAEITALGLNLTSDRRKKKDIRDLNYGLSTVQELTPVSYLWAKDFDDSTHREYGFIAQDLEMILPNLVRTNEEGYKSVNYVGLIPILTKSIQEQQVEIDSLTQEVNALKEQLSEIKALLEK